MDSNDKKIKSIMEQSLKDLVLPRLGKIEKKLVEHDGKFEKQGKKLDNITEMVAKNTEDIETIKDDVSGLKTDVSGLKKDMKIVKEDVSDVQATSNRIETLAKSEIKYVDDLSGRVLKLETKKA